VGESVAVEEPKEIKPESMADSKFEALKDLKIEIEQGGTERQSSKKGRPTKDKVPGPSPDEIKKEVEEIADVIISMTNTFCTTNGLSPLNPLQITILKTGLVGTAIKYNLRLDDQPELILAGGALWIAADKYSELKKLRKEKNDQNDHREEGFGQDDSNEASH